MRPELDPHIFVIFGGTGDLTKRKLLPALAGLTERGLLPEGTTVLAVARSKAYDDEGYRAWTQEPLEEDGAPSEVPEAWCQTCLYYQSLGESTKADYEALRDRLVDLEKKHGLPGNRVLYLALPPGAFRSTIENLGEVGLNDGPGWTRVVIEKPFGHDLKSARELNALVHTRFDEAQVYRIDHYLGKETVQNLLVFRFANPLFEAVWNRDRVDSVHITVAEQVGVGYRAGYYDRAGALRDMVQNHLTQLMTLVAMEVPAAFEADDIRAEKIKVLRAVSEIGDDDVVLGQYIAGSVNGEEAAGYLDEQGIPADSKTETYAALRLQVANWRWQGVPFYLRTGKRMTERQTRIVVVFKRPPVALFQRYSQCEPNSNTLTITVQPDEGFSLRFEVKTPGEGIDVTTQRLNFAYADAFGELREAYETLLVDVIEGDQTLFVHAEEAESSWRLFDPLLEKPRNVKPYPAGSWGPPEAEEMLEMTGTSWARP